MIQIQIPFSEIEFTYVRSRGPGGQNVNRTNSAAILRWNLWNSQAFTEDVKQKIAHKLSEKMTEDGDLIIRSDVHRDQDQNRSECIRRLQELLKKSLFVPKKRVATKPTKSSQRKRVETKKRLGEIKVLRKKVTSS
ncbi:MAG: alternative ribosome rescue aminoacyl-tRNA hydrolase ArfB [Pseudobdellovibrionaceae bacterium]